MTPTTVAATAETRAVFAFTLDLDPRLGNDDPFTDLFILLGGRSSSRAASTDFTSFSALNAERVGDDIAAAAGEDLADGLANLGLLCWRKSSRYVDLVGRWGCTLTIDG